jgi:hypothetical protein
MPWVENMELVLRMANKRASEQVPCYCPKCNGALCHNHTEQRHRSKNYAPVPDFLEWRARTVGAGRSAPPAEATHASGLIESDTDTGSASNVDLADRMERPLKQPRTLLEMVCFHHTVHFVT